MKTTLEIDEKLLKEAMAATGQDTMRETIEVALKEVVARKKRERLTKLIGTMNLNLSLKDLKRIRKNEHVPD
jgi:Arc/MetJ family transcription regulator